MNKASGGEGYPSLFTRPEFAYLMSLSGKPNTTPTHKLEISNWWEFNCPDCQIKFENYDLYEKHCKTHSSERPFVCPFCAEYRNDNPTNFKRHVATHTGDRPYKCEFCKYSTIRKTDLQRHSKKKHKI